MKTSLSLGVNQRHVIDCNSNPFVPDGWQLAPEKNQLSNRVLGIINLSATTITLYQAKEQRSGEKYVCCEKALGKISKKLLFGAQALDYLLLPCNQSLIPEKWNKKFILFLGTIYCRVHSSDYYVRRLFWDGCSWRWDFFLLKRGLNQYDNIAVILKH